MAMFPQGDPDEHLVKARRDYNQAFQAGRRSAYDEGAPFVIIALGLGGLVFPVLGDITHWTIGYGIGFLALGLGCWWWYAEQED